MDLELLIRTSGFAVVFAAMGLWQVVAIEIATVLAFGIPVVAMLLFEVMLNATSLFKHANVTMAAGMQPARKSTWSRLHLPRTLAGPAGGRGQVARSP